jgi:hypothetical protein
VLLLRAETSAELDTRRDSEHYCFFAPLRAAQHLGVVHAASPCVCVCVCFCEWSSVICVRDLRREAIVLPVSGYPISGLHCMLRVHVSAPIHWRFQRNQPTFSNLHVLKLNQIFCRPQRQWTASSLTRSSFGFCSRHGRWPCPLPGWSSWGARFKAGAACFFFCMRCDRAKARRRNGTIGAKQGGCIDGMGPKN